MAKSLQEMLDNPNARTVTLKKKIIREKLKEEKCEVCGLGPIWNNRKLVLQLHHIDGDRTNNILENLQIICPNCHTQTENYNVGLTKNRDRPETRKVERPSKEELIELIINNSLRKIAGMYGVHENSVKQWATQYGIKSKSQLLFDLGLTKLNPSEEYNPKDIRPLRRKQNKPSKEELEEKLKNQTYLSISLELDVNPSSIQKWAKEYKLDEIRRKRR